MSTTATIFSTIKKPWNHHKSKTVSIKTIKDIEAIEQATPNPFENLGSTWELIKSGAEIDLDKPALSFILDASLHKQPATWTHKEWLSDITRTANMLRRLGLQKDEVIAYVLPNLPETHLTIWGGETAGIVFAVNPMLDGDQMGQLLAAAKVSWLVTISPNPQGEIWQRVEEAVTAQGIQLKGVLAVNVLRHVPGSANGSATSEAQADLPETLAGAPVLDFHYELSKEQGDSLEFDPPKAEDTASYFCTGGTTGLPKIALHSHRNECVNALQVRGAVPELFNEGGTTLTCLPLFHVNAQLSGLGAFAQGGKVLLGPPAGYRAPGLMEAFWEIIAHHKVTTFSAVPTIYAGLLEFPSEEHDLSSLVCCICGAAPMPVELLNKFERVVAKRVIEGYGLTESSAVASITPIASSNTTGSIGLRLPWQQMKPVILDEDGNYVRDANIDEVGVIAISGDNVFKGYLSEQHNASAWINIPGTEQNWLNTGDLGRMDQDGYFWLTGRKKELIIRGGHNIDPKTIEEVFAAHPDVTLGAAVGRPDAHAGEVPVIYVQLEPGAQSNPQELQDFANQHIKERAAIPKEVIVMDVLPTTAVGKIFKPALNIMEVERTVKAVAEKLEVTLSQIKVEQDSKRGIVAQYKIETGDEQVYQAELGSYAFISEALA